MPFSFSRDRERRERVPGEEVEEGVVKIKQEPEDGKNKTCLFYTWKRTEKKIHEYFKIDIKKYLWFVTKIVER